MGPSSRALVAATAVLRVDVGLEGPTPGLVRNSKPLCEKQKCGKLHWEKVIETEQLIRIGNKMQGQRVKNQARNRYRT